MLRSVPLRRKIFIYLQYRLSQTESQSILHWISKHSLHTLWWATHTATAALGQTTRSASTHTFIHLFILLYMFLVVEKNVRRHRENKLHNDRSCPVWTLVPCFIVKLGFWSKLVLKRCCKNRHRTFNLYLNTYRRKYRVKLVYKQKFVLCNALLWIMVNISVIALMHFT